LYNSKIHNCDVLTACTLYAITDIVLDFQSLVD